MSLWYESLGLCLDDCREDTEERARCILAHLSMDVPRSWWEHALQTGSVPESFTNILHDLHEELSKTSEFTEDIGFGLLVALAFADDDTDQQKPRFGTVYWECSVEQYLAKAKEILAKRPELGQLGQAIEKRNTFFEPTSKVAGKGADSRDSLKGKKEGSKMVKKDVAFKSKSEADKLTEMFKRGDFDDLIDKELACEIRLTLSAEDRMFFDKESGLTEEDIKFFESTHQAKDKIKIIWDHNKEDFEKKTRTWLTQIMKNKKSIQDNRAKFHQWDPLRIYLSVTDARSGQFSVRFLGQEVAKLRIENNKAFLVIENKHERTNKPYFKCDELKELKAGTYLWTGTEAKIFRANFKSAKEKNTKPYSPEHRVESDFIKEMLKEDRNKFGGNLKNIQPVTIEGMPFQMPLPISASKGVPIARGHGHIDILARRGLGRQVRISVWELKEPNGKIDHVVEQVYIYAVALLYMLRSDSGQCWYELFGFNGKIPAKLDIEAVVAISEKKRENCIKKFQKFIDKNSSYMNVNGDTIKLFMGLYDLDGQGGLGSVNLVPLKPIEKAL